MTVAGSGDPRRPDGGDGSPAAVPLGALRSLTAKQAVVTLVIALLFGILGSAAELVFDWRSMRQDTAATMRQTLAMVEPSAAEAAYQLNEALARRVTSGLAGYASVTRVTLRDDFDGVLAEHTGTAGTGPRHVAERLFGDLTRWDVPLSHGGRAVGTLAVELDAALLAQPFFDRAAYNAVMGLLRALAICGVVVLAFYLMITRPLLRLSQEVGRIDPGNPGAALVPAAAGHRHDELGGLISTLNHLLTAFQRGLDQRDRAETELTSLTLELEARVEQRTAALAAAKDEIEQLNGRLAAENLRLERSWTSPAASRA